MPPKASTKRAGPDLTEVLAELAKQKTETTAALMGVLKAQGDSAAADRQEFKEALKELTASNQNHTLAINDLKNVIEKRDISCDAHAKKINLLEREVVGDGPGDTCSAKSRIGVLETNHNNLDAAFKGFRTHHNDEADAFRKEVRDSLAKLNGVQDTAVKTGATWAIKALWGAVVLLLGVIAWGGGVYYTNVIQPALQAHSQTHPVTKP